MIRQITTSRRVALAETVVEGKELAVASVHLSWWDKGFQEEWARFEAVLKRIEEATFLLAGDFNNPAGQEGYQAILASPLNLQDAFEVAKERSGSYTVPPEIDGWREIANLFESIISLQQRMCR